MTTEQVPDSLSIIGGFAREAIRTAVLINGGAAIAVLAFMAQLLSTDISVETIHLLSKSAFIFVFGVVLAGTASMFLWFVSIDHIAVSQAPLSKRRSHDRSGWWNAQLTMGCMGGALVLFAVGAIFAISAFTRDARLVELN